MQKAGSQSPVRIRLADLFNAACPPHKTYARAVFRKALWTPLLQALCRLPHNSAADAELFGQQPLGWQPALLGGFFTANESGELFANAFDERRRTVEGGESHGKVVRGHTNYAISQRLFQAALEPVLTWVGQIVGAIW